MIIGGRLERILGLTLLLAVVSCCRPVACPAQPEAAAVPAAAADRDVTLEDISPLDDTHWWLAYRYLTPGADPLVPVLRELADRKELVAGDPAVAETIQFFAALAKGRRDEIDRIRSLSVSSTGTEGEVLRQIVSLAEHYPELKPDSKEHIDQLWAEYRALGDPGSIRKIVAVLAVPVAEENRSLQELAATSLLFRVPRHPEVHDLLSLIVQNTVLPSDNRLSEVVRALTGLKETASIHADRANNLLRNGRYDEVRAQLRESAKHFTTERVFNTAASYYLTLGAPDKAQPFLKRGLEFWPRDSWALMQLGHYHFQRREYDAAIGFLERAVVENPKAAPVLYDLVCSHCEKGNHDRALLYAVQYLNGVQNPAAAQEMRRYLALHGIPIPPPRPRPAEMIRMRDFRQLNEHFGQLLSRRERDEDGWGLLRNAYREISACPSTPEDREKRLADLQAWAQAKPDSHFAHACLGIYLKEYAWKARGTGWGVTVSEEGWKLFRDRLALAEESLETAFRLDASDPVVPANLIMVAMGLGRDREVAELNFRRAVQADAGDFTAYDAMLTYLSPAWGGSKEQMFAFAREQAKGAPADSPLPRLVAKAHWAVQSLTRDTEYFKEAQAWREVKEAYTAFLKAFPRSAEVRNWLARTASMAGDVDTAREQMGIIGDAGLPDVWGSTQAYHTVRAYVLALPATP